MLSMERIKKAVSTIPRIFLDHYFQNIPGPNPVKYSTSLKDQRMRKTIKSIFTNAINVNTKARTLLT